MKNRAAKKQTATALGGAGFFSSKAAPASLIVFFALAALVAGPASMPVVDSAYYADLAKSLLTACSFQANFEPASHNPVFPVVLSFFMLAFGSLWAKAYAVFSAAALTAAFWFFAKQFFPGDARKVFLATLSFMLFPVVFYSSLELLSDALFLVFSLAAATAYLRLRKLEGNVEGNARAFVAGEWIVFTVLAILTRNTGFVLAGVFVAHGALERLFLKNPEEERVSLKLYAAFAAVVALASAAWLFAASQTALPATVSYAGRLAGERFGEIAFSVKDFAAAADGSVSALNPAVAFDVRVPLFASYFLRLCFYLLVFVSPIALFAAKLESWRKTRSAALAKLDSRFVLLGVWFAAFFLFHVFWPLALSFRYVAPLAIPVAVLFAACATRFFDGDKKALAFTLIALNFACCFAVIYWDASTRWSKSRAAAYVFERTGEMIQRGSDSGEEVFVQGAPFAAVSFYSGRKAVSGQRDVALISNYFGDSPAPQWLSRLSGYRECGGAAARPFYAKIYARDCRVFATPE